jgi:hypothetical protein
MAKFNCAEVDTDFVKVREEFGEILIEVHEISAGERPAGVYLDPFDARRLRRKLKKLLRQIEGESNG